MELADLKRHYLLKNAKRTADVLGCTRSAVYQKADGSIPLKIEELVQLLIDSEDGVFLEEYGSRIGYLLVPKPKTGPSEENITGRVAALANLLSNGKKVDPSECFCLGLALIAYADSLRNGGPQREMFADEKA